MSSIETPWQTLNSADCIEHIRDGSVGAWITLGQKKWELGRESSRAGLFLPLVFDLAEESRPHKGVSLLYVGQICGQQRSFYLKSSILIDSSNSRLLALANDKVFVAISDDLKGVVGILRVDPFAQEL
jgi:hypothetical protein